ncbi:MAG: GAP family protein [Solirubrobacterales bacterium]|nr:GAP family protein [Solirubrobacterales bacterium]
MGEAIGQTLPLAAAVAISPFGIVAAVLMLTSGRGSGNGLAFLIGWFAGLMVVGGLLILLGRGADASSGGQPAEWTGYAKILLGLLLLVVAHRQRTKKADDGEPKSPKWLNRISTLNPPGAFSLGVGLGAVNPKNLVLTMGAAAAITGTGSPTDEQVLSLLAYALIGSLGAAVPLGIYYFMGDRAEGMLERLKERMARNNGVIMAVICVLIAAKLIGDGISTLSLF